MSREGDTGSATPAQVRVAAVGSYSASAPGFRVRMLLPRTRLAGEQVFLTPLTLLTEDEEAAFHRDSPPTRLRLVAKARKRLLAELDSLREDVSVMVIQRQADLLALTTVERHAIANRALVYDVDDAIWLDTRGANGSIFAMLKGSRRKARWLAQRAEHVIAGNEILAEYLAPLASDITVIPSVVDTATSPIKIHADGDEFTVGWIGSRTTAPYVERARTALERVARDLSPQRVRFLMVGGKAKPLRGVTSEAIPWSIENERDALKRMDVGIMPQPDTPWTRGKCAYKAIQYMAASVPVVADDVGMAAKVVGEAGVLAHSDADWFEALTSFANNVTLRNELGTRGRARANQEFSVARWAPVFGDLLRRAGR